MPARACAGISNVIRSDPRFFSATIAPGTPSQASSSPVIDQVVGSTNVVDRAAIFYRRVRAVIKTILENPDSRKIYYFLCLNLAYMLVQMMCVWSRCLAFAETERLPSGRYCTGMGFGRTAWGSSATVSAPRLKVQFDHHTDPKAAIHMFFDCMALGMGLLASVMATWARDDRFTYG